MLQRDSLDHSYSLLIFLRLAASANDAALILYTRVLIAFRMCSRVPTFWWITRA